MVGTRNELQGGLLRHRVNWYPETQALASFNVVIGLILMPRSTSLRSRLLYEDVIVVDASGATIHETSRNTPELSSHNKVR